MRSYATLGWRHDELFQAVAAQIEWVGQRCNSQEMANLTWAFATIGQGSRRTSA